MATTLQLSKWNGEHLLTVHVSRAGYAGKSIELYVDAGEYAELLSMGVPTLEEE